MCVYEVVFYEGGNITLRVFVRARNSRDAVVHTLNEVGYTCEFDRVMVTSMTDAVLIDTVADKGK